MRGFAMPTISSDFSFFLLIDYYPTFFSFSYLFGSFLIYNNIFRIFGIGRFVFGNKGWEAVLFLRDYMCTCKDWDSIDCTTMTTIMSRCRSLLACSLAGNTFMLRPYVRCYRSFGLFPSCCSGDWLMMFFFLASLSFVAIGSAGSLRAGRHRLTRTYGDCPGTSSRLLG